MEQLTEKDFQNVIEEGELDGTNHGIEAEYNTELLAKKVLSLHNRALKENSIGLAEFVGENFTIWNGRWIPKQGLGYPDYSIEQLYELHQKNLQSTQPK